MRKTQVKKAQAKPTKPAAARRIGVTSSQTRGQLIEAAAQILHTEGHAAITARRLAEAVGLKREIVHYYFRTIEDLLLAVMQREGDRLRLVLVEATESKQPLRAIWSRSRNVTASFLEFIVLAGRHQAIQAEVKRYLEDFRQIQTEALARHMEARGTKSHIPPVALILMLQSLVQTLTIETGLGVSTGHAEVAAVVEDFLRVFEQSEGQALPETGSIVQGRRRATSLPQS